MTGDNFTAARVSKELAQRRLGANSEAAEMIADADDPLALIDAIADGVADDVKMVDASTVEEYRDAASNTGTGDESDAETESDAADEPDSDTAETPQTTEDVEAEVEESEAVESSTEDRPSIHDESDSDTDDTEDTDGGPDDEPEADADDAEDEDAEDAFNVEGDIPDKPERESDDDDERATAGPVPDEEVIEEDEPNEDGDAATLLLEDEKDTEPDGVTYIAGEPPVVGASPEERWPDAWERTLVDEPLPNEVSRATDQRSVTIEGDITGNSRTTGTVDDFQRLFRDRYKRLQSILKDRMPPTSPLDSLEDERRAGKTVAVTGMVNEVRKTKNGHDLIELEDTTGTFPVLFSEGYTDEPVKEQIERIIADEVIGVVGTLADDAGIMFGDELYFPDIPPMRTPNTADRDVKAVLLSDIHIGAVDFAADEWQRFVEWMHTSEEAEDVEYILIAGDLVEGIGVYPGQEKELDVVDIYDQYVLCAEAFKQLPDDVDIYTIMGNHDTVRLAEPQPVIKDTLKAPFADNVHFAGNPAIVDVEGVKFQLYHGMSLNPLTDRTPGLDIHEPEGAMELMLQKRHLAPMYGMNVRLAPEQEDYLVIDDIPDVLHTGHVHTFGIDSYKNTLMVNTGCWQYQTDFQKKMNVDPDVGYAPIIDLSTLNVEVKQF